MINFLLKDLSYFGKVEKARFDSIIQWWEVGKVHIKLFCQQYASHSTVCLKKTLEQLEQEIIAIERNMTVNNVVGLQEKWTEKKLSLSSILNEKVKGALIRSRFLTVRDMDAPTSFFLFFLFFFNLERKAAQDKQMYSLKNSVGRIISDPVEMRRMDVDFYSTLFAADNSDGHARNELLQDLPVLTSEQKKCLEKGLTFDELSASVMELLSLGRTPGIDGLLTEFYRSLWTVIRIDFFLKFFRN